MAYDIVVSIVNPSTFNTELHDNSVGDGSVDSQLVLNVQVGTLSPVHAASTEWEVIASP